MRALALLLSSLFIACGTDTFTATDGSMSDGSTDASVDASLDGMLPDGGTGDGGPGGIKDVPGLVLWLNGAVGLQQSAGRVTTWNDQSGNGNNAIAPNNAMVDGAAVDARPEYVAQSINSRPGVRFRTDQFYQLVINDSMTLRWGTGDFLLEVVARFSNDPNNNEGNAIGCMFFKGAISSNQGPGLFANVFTSGPGQVGASAMVDLAHTASSMNAYNDGNGRIYGMRRIGGNLELRVNGTVVATSAGASADVSQSGMTVRIGSLFSGASYRLDGEIDEVIGVVGNGAASHLNIIEALLKAKYNL